MFIQSGTDCESTLSAIDSSQPSLLQDMRLEIRTPDAGAPGKLEISGGDRRMNFHATLVEVGGQWRILAVAP